MKRNNYFDGTSGAIDLIVSTISVSMFRRQSILLTLMFASTLNMGCCWRRDVPANFCPPPVSYQVPLSVTPKPDGAGVTANFDFLPPYDSIKQSVLAAEGTVAIDLEEAVCLAARNSELADAIDRERQLLDCQDGQPCQKTAIDIALQGEALEQRNIVAGAAGELFLGLVQVSLQMELLEEARAHIEQLQIKVDAADEAGFATAEGKNEVAKGRLELQRKQVELGSAHQELTWQLNMLVDPRSDTAVVFEPVHDLNPQPLNVDVRAETFLAETKRPGVRATEMALSTDRSGMASYQLLKIFDSRLGLKLNASPIKKRLLRKQIVEIISQSEKSDATLQNRQHQIRKIVEARKREASVAAGKALLDSQTAFEKLTIIQADIIRLQKRAESLYASKEVDAKDVYLKENENWIELQKARSERIAAAIEYEIAQIKLLQSQGQLVESCGFQLELPSSCTVNQCGLQ